MKTIMKLMMCIGLMLSISISSLTNIYATQEDIGLNGQGTLANPFQIASEDDLIAFKDYINASTSQNNNSQACAILTEDIHLTHSWESIDHFDGVFNGQNHTIHDLSLSSSESKSGMFTKNSGYIMNLKVTGSIAASSDYVGGIVGVNTGKLTNVSFEGLIHSDQKESLVGGITGLQAGTLKNGMMQGSIVVTGTGSSVGGIAGMNQKGKITHVTNQANIQAHIENNQNNDEYESMAGGITGFNYEGQISEAVNEGQVSLTDVRAYVGGITGLNNGSIVQAGNMGDIDGNGYQGGLVGYLFKNTQTTKKSEAKLEKSFQTTELKAIGYNDKEHPGTMNSCLSLGDETLNQNDIFNGSLAWQMNLWSDTKIWHQNIGDSQSYPYLSHIASEDEDIVYKNEDSFTNACDEVHQHVYDSNGLCTICGEKMVDIKGISMVLDGSLGLNMIIEADDTLSYDNIDMKVTVKKRTTSIPVDFSHTIQIEGKTYYKCRIDLNSGEMTEDIDVSAIAKTNGKTYTIKQKSFRGYDYLEKAVEEFTEQETLIDIVSELATYDYYGYQYFQTAQDDYLASLPYRKEASLDQMNSEVVANSIQTVAPDQDDYVLKHASTNMVLREWVSGYYSAAIKDEKDDPQEVFIGYKKTSEDEYQYNPTVKSNNRYYGYGPKIASSEFETLYDIAFFTKDDQGQYVQISSVKTTSVYCYIYGMLKNNENKGLEKSLQSYLLKSLYYYGEVSKSYFRSVNNEL